MTNFTIRVQSTLFGKSIEVSQLQDLKEAGWSTTSAQLACDKLAKGLPLLQDFKVELVHVNLILHYIHQS